MKLTNLNPWRDKKSIAQSITAIVCGLSLSACQLTQPNHASQASTEQSAPQTIIISGSNKAPYDGGIYQTTLNPKTGELSPIVKLANAISPSYLAWDPANKETLYSVIQTKTGGLGILNRKSDNALYESIFSQTELAWAPCHIGLSPDNSQVAIANYMSGDIHLFDVDGAKTTLASHYKHHGKGTHQRQESPHLHWINWSPSGKHLFSIDLGTDSIYGYNFKNGKIVDSYVAFKTQSEDGPRHMAFHPNKDLAYVINELSNTIIVLAYDAKTGMFNQLQRINTVDKSHVGHSQAAAIKVSKDGNFVYVSNRGANSIAGFKVNSDGTLVYLHNQSTGGDWPRDFTISADGQYVLVANRRSNTINVLKRDVKTGYLSATPHVLNVPDPTFISPF
ncbi:lactonase family protein [Algibacillus agarilyticus]|uniref:lactonase family protein n=1 Tax=Algibacillus agarilyticus TaxID=2234133 RepID=UPI000DD01AAF|nr:lactonase family protein [Algibacillus agarilyticus]